MQQENRLYDFWLELLHFCYIQLQYNEEILDIFLWGSQRQL
jgi:hypothetical protein